MGGRHLRPSRNHRVVIAGAGRRRQGFFIEPALHEFRQFHSERSLDETGIRRREGVLRAERTLRPGRRLLLRGKPHQLAKELVTQDR